jgi:hypothetical protein
MTYTAVSRNGVTIRLNDERWSHIVRRHPEMEGQRGWVLETLTEPDMIQQGDFGELLAIRFYFGTPLTDKYLVAAYRETDADDGFILTAYFTNRPSAGRVTVWKP